jgi:hypothetical protein
VRGWGRVLRRIARTVIAAACLFAIQAQAGAAGESGAVTGAPAASPALNYTYAYVVRYDRWTDADERGFGEFVSAIGHADCHTVDSCLHDTANPFRASDPEGISFRSDCADLPYYLRFYYAWKHGLPFGYVSAVSPRGHTRDIRYTAKGNFAKERTDARDAGVSGYAILDAIRDAVSSATYRIHPDLEEPEEPDLYSPRIDAKSIRPGTVIYDPNGHLAIVYEVEPDGRIHYIDAHPDNALTRGFYDLRFVRASPGMGAGFKNWRPMWLEGATRDSDGHLVGGTIEVARNKDIPSFSDEQFFGNGTRPDDDSNWRDGTFTLNGEILDYYDYVRAKLAGGKLEFDPIKEVRDMVESNCADLHYRADAVNLAIAAGIERQPQPDQLPPNIYGTEGDWETYSTPSRDARLKTAFKELRDMAERFIRMGKAKDPHLVYAGKDQAQDMLNTYEHAAASCAVTYQRTDGSTVTLSYEEARRRLFLLSFDPYHCIERRWGASDAKELATCSDGAEKQAWYMAEQKLRNQIDRTYDAQMGFTLDELGTPGPGKGLAMPPDIDTHGYLQSLVPAKKPDDKPQPSSWFPGLF